MERLDIKFYHGEINRGNKKFTLNFKVILALDFSDDITII